MEETIKTTVITSEKDTESELSFSYSEDVITLKVDNKEICTLDYNYNMAPLIKRMIEIWGEPQE